MIKKSPSLFKEDLLEINNFAFIVFLISYIFFLIIENVTDKFISTFFNYNILLYICVITGLLMLILDKNKDDSFKITKKDYLLIITLALISSATIFIKTKELGWLSPIISIFTGVIVYISLSTLLRSR